MEHISLHGYIRNTPPDTEDLAEHHLRVGKRTCHQKKVYRTTQNLVGQRNEDEKEESE